MRVRFGVDLSEFLLGGSVLISGCARVVSVHLGPLYCLISWRGRA